MSRFFVSPKLEILMTAEKGRGVFATEDIKAGEVLEVAPVLLIPKEQDEAIMSTLLKFYAFYAKGEDGGSLIALGWASIYNDSKQWNTVYDTTKDDITFTAAKDIKRGEEVTTDYAWHKKKWKQAGGRK